jgi:ribosomal protein S27AE
MRKELACPRCGRAVFWHIRHVPEQAGELGERALAISLQRPPPTPWWKLAYWRGANDPIGSGWFELLVCEGCSHVEWYARDVDGAKLTLEAFACPACGNSEAWRVPTLKERAGQLSVRIKPLPVLAGGLGVDGYYSLAVCTGCGFTEFRARDLEGVSEHRFGVSVDKTACRCGAPDRLRIAEAQEGTSEGMRPMYLSRADGGRGRTGDVGGLSPTICRRCGATEWRACGIGDLREDATRGVSRFDAKERFVDSRGPYR